MSIEREALEAIRVAPSAVDSFKATLDALALDQTISKEVCAIVKHALDHSAAKLEPAIRANVHN